MPSFCLGPLVGGRRGEGSSDDAVLGTWEGGELSQWAIEGEIGL